MAVSQVEIMAAQECRKLFGALAMSAAQEPLLPQILDIQCGCDASRCLALTSS